MPKLRIHSHHTYFNFVDFLHIYFFHCCHLEVGLGRTVWSVINLLTPFNLFYFYFCYQEPGKLTRRQSTYMPKNNAIVRKI